ncbi:MAG: prolyl oligopeptidase family serine peptidase [Anaerolineae bacterium]|nr:prolyl oligopeptidase family serine peptidase [Anaerolineae bacterium]NIN94919.1 prolyl oligopeptidase family serine peptidase [Anaerolineae bacterium]NIQ77969.1 prolyl oligopeptidase family serine peptidase [Anaerolineae bacterium]
MRKLSLVFIAVALCLSACRTGAAPVTPTGDGQIVDRQTYQLSREERDELLAWGMTEQEIDGVSVEDITYLSDDLRIKGYLLQPQEDDLYPAIIYNAGDGGPSPLEMMPYAIEGYVVVSSWLRGHGGSEGEDQYGGADLNDVLNLIPLVRGLPKADASRMAMVGVSRGGMMTYLALTRTHEIRVAAVRGARSNLMCGMDPVQRHLGGDERTVPKAYFTRSAVNFAHLISAPVLIQHSDQDRAWEAHAHLMAGALEYYGKPHKLTIYDAGDHDEWDYILEAFEEQLEWIAGHVEAPMVVLPTEAPTPSWPRETFANDGQIVERRPHEFSSDERETLLRVGMTEEEVEGISVEQITYMSEGLRIKGYLLQPEAEGSHPMLIHNRGGAGLEPAPLMLYAREGYIIVASWLRGWGGSEGAHDELGHVNDVLNLVPLAKSLPNADPDRIAMGGISYGGRMTYRVLARTDEIKVAYAIGAPSVDCEWGEFEERDYEQPESYFAPSPIHFAYLFNTPVLIQHGGADPHVLSKNAQLMAAALDYYGKPHRLSIYEGGNHNLSTHWREAFEERIDWMASHLQSP